MCFWRTSFCIFLLYKNRGHSCHLLIIMNSWNSKIKLKLEKSVFRFGRCLWIDWTFTSWLAVSVFLLLEQFMFHITNAEERIGPLQNSHLCQVVCPNRGYFFSSLLQPLKVWPLFHHHASRCQNGCWFLQTGMCWCPTGPVKCSACSICYIEMYLNSNYLIDLGVCPVLTIILLRPTTSNI